VFQLFIFSFISIKLSVKSRGKGASLAKFDPDKA
jgi:hypothetical protein